MKGRVKRWFGDKGYGFISRFDDGGDVFLHISNMRTKRPPRIGSIVYFDIIDDHGKPRAVNVQFKKRGPNKIKVATMIFLVVTAVLLGLHFTHLVAVPIPILFYTVASLLAFLMYHADKRAAQKQRKRISEATLHMVELFGGWPGSWLASQFFRHKTVKTSYRIMFWIIVLLHVALWFWLIKSGCTLNCTTDQFLDILFAPFSSGGNPPA